MKYFLWDIFEKIGSKTWEEISWRNFTSLSQCTLQCTHKEGDHNLSYCHQTVKNSVVIKMRVNCYEVITYILDNEAAAAALECGLVHQFDFRRMWSLLQDKDNFISSLIYFIGFSTSIIALLIALFIFLYFRCDYSALTRIKRRDLRNKYALFVIAYC